MQSKDVNLKQVGGNHYRTKYQHWDLMIKYDVPYMESQITRYVTRARKKNGLEDMEKGIHYLEKVLSLPVYAPIYAKRPKAIPTWDIEDFCKSNYLNPTETTLILNTLQWTTPKELHHILKDMQNYLVALQNEQAAKATVDTSGMEHPFGYQAEEESIAGGFC